MNNLNYHCKWRLDIAKQICEKIRGMEGAEGIKAIVVGGSVARGYADEYSDVEIPMFWDNLPDEDTRKLIVRELNAEYFYPYNYETREDNIIIDGFRIDLWHISLEQEEEVVKSVTKDFEVDFGSSNAMDTLRACIPLFGEELIYPWKNKAKEYPREIAVKSINEALKSIDCTQVGLYLRRENSTLLFEHIVCLQKKIFLMLLALNKQYFPTFKWMYKSLETLKIKPKDIGQRFKDSFTCQPRKAFENTVGILLETLDFVNKTYPEIDTSVVLSRLKSSRIAHYNSDSIHL